MCYQCQPGWFRLHTIHLNLLPLLPPHQNDGLLREPRRTKSKPTFHLPGLSLLPLSGQTIDGLPSQQTEVCPSMFWGREIESGRQLLEMEDERHIGLAESQLFHYLSGLAVSVYIVPHTVFGLHIFSCWSKRKNCEKIDWGPLIAFWTAVLESSELKVSRDVLWRFWLFKKLSSVIFNNPWVNTGRDCSINNWREIYK